MLVAYHWPPDPAIGALRPLRLAGQLMLRGCRPFVLTIPERETCSADVSAQSMTIVRVRPFPSLRQRYLFCKRIFSRVMGSPSDGGVEDCGPTEYGIRPSDETMVARLRRIILSLLWVPDEQLGWLIPATVRAIQLIRAERIRCVVSTGPPHTPHLIATLAARACQIPHVIDFRDPWVGNDQKPWHVQSESASVLDEWLERMAVQHAARIVSVTAEMTDHYRHRYPQIPGERFETIPNGFLAAEYPIISRHVPSESRVIRYLGSFSYTRTPLTILDALRILREQNPSLISTVSVEFVGLCRHAKGLSVQQLIDERGLSAIVRIVEAVPRQEAIRLMSEAHMLLLLAPDQPLQIPGKFYEYLAVGRPMLVETEPHGATSRIVNETSCGQVVPVGDVGAMAMALTACQSVSLFVPAAKTHDAFEWTALGAQYHRMLLQTMADFATGPVK